jgi:ABC-2 type transport system ATP-binding protein
MDDSCEPAKTKAKWLFSCYIYDIKNYSHSEHWMKTIISVKNLVKKYGDFVAVNDISFTVREGEVFGLLGPNGAGKTTTLEIIETLKKATSGTIEVDGFNVTNNPAEVKRRIGIQLQSSGFYPDLTLLELLGMFGVMYGVHVDAPAMLHEVNLEAKAKSTFKDLSGGQKQRFSIATTLINKPRIIFLDEPTTGLDPQARVNLWELIETVKKQGVTIVLTTHYMDEAEKLCDRLAVIDNGKIVKEGSPNSMIDDLLQSGFKRHETVRPATLEDVFLNLTGRSLREQ